MKKREAISLILIFAVIGIIFAFIWEQHVWVKSVTLPAIYYGEGQKETNTQIMLTISERKKIFGENEFKLEVSWEEYGLFGYTAYENQLFWSEAGAKYWLISNYEYGENISWGCIYADDSMEHFIIQIFKDFAEEGPMLIVAPASSLKEAKKIKESIEIFNFQ